MQNTETLNLAVIKENVINLNYQKFLVLEGSCNIIINNEVCELLQGDHLYIPTHISYYVKPTSNGFCKALVEGNSNYRFKRILVFEENLYSLKH